MKKSVKIIIAVVLVLLVVISTFAFRAYRQNLKFTTIKPQSGTITEAIYALGKVKSNHRFEVKLGIFSTIKKIYVREGDLVAKNQRLIDLDSGVTFNSPIAGTVTLVSGDDGETVLPQVVLIRVEDLKDRYIELSLEQEGILRIRKGQAARVSFEALRGETLSGTVTALFPKEDEFIAHVEIDHLSDNVLPGMTADVSVEVGQITGLLVPLKAVNNGYVSVQRQNRVEKIKVEVGLSDNLSAEIKGNSLKPDDSILVPKEDN